MQAQAETSPRGRFLTRVAAWLCALMLAAGALPLYAVAMFNHPYYDDYKFSAAVHDVWSETHDLGATLQAAWTSAKEVRQTWQGTYTGTLLSNVQPGVFSENAYWVTTFVLLTAFLLCFGFFLHTLMRRVLGASRAEATCVSCLLLFLMTQFLPEADEAFFWFNGGVGNTFIYSLLALAFALLLRLETSRTRVGAALLIASLVVLTTLLGGGSYVGGLFGLCVCALVCVAAMVRKSRFRWAYLALTAWFVACFFYNMSAPGNAVRAAMIESANGASVSPVKAIAQALYYGAALIGHQLTLPVFAAMLALAPMLYRLTKASRFRFGRPLLVLLASACLYCTQLVPTLYSGVFLGAGRITDTYYFSFIVMLFMAEAYALGWFARRQEAFTLADAGRRGVLIASACLFAIGCVGYKQSDDTLFGPMNMAGGSAALSLVSGEAARYDREMDAREALLNDASQTTVTLSPLTSTPEVFMNDLLSPDATDDVRPMLCAYYHKDAVLIEGGGGQ